MKRIIIQITLVIFSAICLISCDDENQTIELNNYTIQVVPQLSSGEEIIGDLAGLIVVVKDVNTGTEETLVSDSDGKVYFRGMSGIYKATVSGNLYYSSSVTEPGSVLFSGNGENLLFSASNLAATVQITPDSPSKGWVIKEMYTASTRTVNGSALRFDQFIEIYNNTDTVMYADGLAIGETRHQTTTGENIYINDFSEKTFLWTVYAIPGKTGEKNVPVQPGKSIVIAPQPIDHRPDNSIDLRNPISDYQWFDAYGSGEYSIDVPEVPNLERYYSYSNSVWVVSTAMNRGFVLFQLPERESMSGYVDRVTDMRFNNAGNMVTSIGIENKYIVDAIELGPKYGFYKKSIHSSLDRGYSYALEAYNGKSIRRKISKIESDGRIIYQDTNNSSDDFWTSRTPMPKQFPIDDEVSHE